MGLFWEGGAGVVSTFIINTLNKQFVVVFVHSSGIKVLHANGPSLKVIFIVCIRDICIYGYL